MEKRPVPIEEIPDSLCRDLLVLFTDIDDTITTDGLLPAQSYSSLWSLAEEGIEVVPVTGRPAGWCDHIARMWPVAGVLGENGAFYFSYDRIRKIMTRCFLPDETGRKENIKKLEKLAGRVTAEVPGARIAADQQYRLTDLAIDFREDVDPPLSDEKIRRICSIAAEEGATFKVSSIHVNCWYGDYDKFSCLDAFLTDRFGSGAAAYRERILYIGDSPNDVPLFKALEHTIGVANIKKSIPFLSTLPRYVTSEENAAGFCEAVKIILKKRRA